MLNSIRSLETKAYREMPDIDHGLPIFARGRLTVTKGEPDALADVFNATHVYFTPYIGCYGFPEISLDITTLAASTMHDFFYTTDHTLSAVAWAGANVRATALVRYQGYLRLSTDYTKIFLGSGFIDAGQRIQDALAFRYLGNYYNGIQKSLYVFEGTSHTYNGAFRLWNNSIVNNQLNFIVCQPNGQNALFGFQASLKAGADASYARITYYLDGVRYNAPFINFQNRNVQIIETGRMSVTSAIGTGFHYTNCYEDSNHASSTFDDLFLQAQLMF